MLRNRWLDEVKLSSDWKDYDDSTESSAYEIVEEEVVEILSDKGDDGNLALAGEDEVEIEIDEILQDSRRRLAGISEEDDDEDQSETEYEERSVYTDADSKFGNSMYSLTEVEVEESDMDAIYNGLEQSFIEEDFVDSTIRDEDFSEVEVTVREDDDLGLEHLRITEASAPRRPNQDTGPEDVDDDEEEEDGVSAEECREAIDYILRQERAVARFILTEEQAETMAHLPLKVMKLIVDHMEVCDNNDSPIDWDFLLKIVTPFCDGTGGDGSDEE